MGGGQPTDQGKIAFANGNVADVYQVLLKDGEINHYVKMQTAPIVGQKISGTIDWDRRYKHMKIHSGGHIVDFSMYLLGYSPGLLRPLKGDHGKKPFVLYAGVLDKEIKEELQKKVDELTVSPYKFSWSFQPVEILEKEALYLQPGLPKNKPLRALKLEGVGTVADGGTIVASTQEVGKVTIVSVESSGTETTIKYQVAT